MQSFFCQYVFQIKFQVLILAMKIAITLSILLIVNTAYGQHKPRKNNQSNENSDWEDDGARRFFRKNYKRQDHQCFAGMISVPGNGIYKYNEDIIIVHDTTEAIQHMFEKGILHSGLFGGGQQHAEHPDVNSMSANQKTLYGLTRTDTLYVGGITELPLLSKSAKIKRFRFLLFRKGFANPTEYYFELTNPVFKSTDPPAEFIKGASLTFFKQHSILI